jgi:hypothetical protein
MRSGFQKEPRLGRAAEQIARKNIAGCWDGCWRGRANCFTTSVFMAEPGTARTEPGDLRPLDEPDELASLHNLGTVAYLMGECGNITSFCSKAWRCTGLEQPLGHCQGLEHPGNTAMALGDYQTARNNLQASLDLAKNWMIGADRQHTQHPGASCCTGGPSTIWRNSWAGKPEHVPRNQDARGIAYALGNLGGVIASLGENRKRALYQT